MKFMEISFSNQFEGEDTSLDILTGTMRYLFSLERNAKLREMSPVARTLQSIVNDPDQIKTLNDFQKQSMFNRAIEKPTRNNLEVVVNSVISYLD